MLKTTKLRLVAIFFGLSSILNAQKDVTTVGFMFKPMLPIDIFTGGEVTTFNESFTTSTNFASGTVGGMIIRQGLTNSLSLETGINFNRRNYNLDFNDQNNNITGSADFRIIGYEIPVSLLINVRLGEKMFMNAAAGVGLDFYPSDVTTEVRNRFTHYSTRNGWVQPAFNVNVGFEYRTIQDGYFYFGLSYHQTFSDFTITDYRYTTPPPIVNAVTERIGLSGSYFALDIRYFFHEPPEKKEKKKRKKSK